MRNGLSRDLCRLRIFQADHQDTFLRAYWHGREEGFELKRRLYRLYHGTFLLRNHAKAWLRSPLSGFQPRRAHAHIPPPPEDAGARDGRVVVAHHKETFHGLAGSGEMTAMMVSVSGRGGIENDQLPAR